MKKNAVLILILCVFISLHTSFAQEENEGAVITAQVMQLPASPVFLDDLPTLTGVAKWQTPELNYFGQEQHIGILDNGFHEWDSLRENITINPIRTTDSDETHGTNVLQVAAAIAPLATYHICEYNNFDEFSSCINNFSTAVDGNPVDVIIHSAGIPARPIDGLTRWSSLIQDVYEQPSDIVWVNAAGNYANGVIETEFSPTEDNLHNFGSLTSELLEIRISPEEDKLTQLDIAPSEIMLVWQGIDTPASSYSFQMNLYRIDESGNRVLVNVGQENVMNIAEPNLSGIRKILPITQDIFVEIKHVGTQNTEGIPLTLLVEYGNFGDVTFANNSVIAPADAGFIITVGALSGRDNVASYSSSGVIADTGENKPDLVTYGEISFGEGQGFRGTSASAPIVGATVALLRQAFPDADADTIRNYLLQFATNDADLSIRNPEITYGFGRLAMPDPNEDLPAQPPVSGGNAPPETSIDLPKLTIVADEVSLRIAPSSSCRRVEIASETNHYNIYQVAEDPDYENGDWYQVIASNGQAAWVLGGADRVSIDGNVSHSNNLLQFIPLTDACSATDSGGSPETTISATDFDNDKVPDAIDECPTWGDIGAGVAPNGCPYPVDPSPSEPQRTPIPLPTVASVPVSDADNDGVPDAIDECPIWGNAGIGVGANGCPLNPEDAPISPEGDPDGDGVTNSQDECPTEGSTGFGVYDNGCPRTQDNPVQPDLEGGDRDGDGVPDTIDFCVNDRGPSDNNGCPRDPDTPPDFSITVTYVTESGGMRWNVRLPQNSDGSYMALYNGVEVSNGNLRGTGNAQLINTSCATSLRVTVGDQSVLATSNVTC